MYDTATEKLTITEKVWTKIADNVTSGMIRLPVQSGAFSFVYTSRTAGGGVPNNADETDGGLALTLFEESRNEEISNSVGIDVYVYPKNNDPDSDDTVEILVDL